MRSCSSAEAWNFYPRPPGGGRPAHFFTLFFHFGFLSTPSGWRATGGQHLAGHPFAISIHALRVEGDRPTRSRSCTCTDFYPRPPGGGRRFFDVYCVYCRRNFYPRPPGGGRQKCPGVLIYPGNFYPRPPGGGRLEPPQQSFCRAENFYPRPPGGGRLRPTFYSMCCKAISIHALRVEGDPKCTKNRTRRCVSIHALRVEGDNCGLLKPVP